MYRKILELRNALIENGKKVCTENPDNLDKEELIKSCPGIKTYTPKPEIPNQDMRNCMIFTHNGRQREREY